MAKNKNSECVNVLDVAKKILAKTDIIVGDTISNLKLQKLLYYMQGYHLAFFDKPLFSDDIVAWCYGPVVPIVYSEYKKYENGAIDIPINCDKITSLPKEQEILFCNVYREYNQFSAVALMEMTHNEAPWKTTPINKIITKSKLSSFFKTQIINE